jgi:hypothetical protein
MNFELMLSCDRQLALYNQGGVGSRTTLGEHNSLYRIRDGLHLFQEVSNFLMKELSSC